MIHIAALTKRFNELVAVRDVSFNVRRGEILGVLGPNGAGKTTTIRILCGYLPPTSGTAKVEGLDVSTHSREIRRKIGYLPENNPLYPEMRVVEYLLFRAGIKAVSRRQRSSQLEKVIALCGLGEVRRQTIGTLSKGFRQRVGLADALIADPPLLILDEPTSGLDPRQVMEVRQLVRGLAGRHTVLFSSHQLHEVEQVAERVVIFRQGQVIAEDTTENLRQRTRRGTAVTVELPQEQEACLPELTAELCRTVGVERLDDGWLRVLLEAEADPREALFTRAQAQRIVLRELTRRRLSLEEVFQELTTAKAPESGAPAPDSPQEDHP